jgi:trigger factor
MKVSSESIENSQVSLNVEMEASEVEEYLEKAYDHLVGRVKVPGFRKGKTPRTILERHIGKDTLLQEALEHLIPDACQKAMDEQKIEAIARPEIQIMQTEPVVFKAIVPVYPTIKLGDYKGIRVETIPIVLTDQEIEAAIQQLRLQQAVLVPVDRPAKMNDAVTMDIEGESEGKPFTIRKDLVYELVKESPLPLPGFSDKLEGIVKDEERSFTLSYPTDYKIPELAGKEYSFKVKVTEIKEQQLPEANDEFAKTMGVESMAAMREQIINRLKERAEEVARSERDQKIIDSAVQLSEIQYPPILTENEIDRLVNDEIRNFKDGLKGLESYLKSVGKTMENHREELRPVANRRVLRSLVLEKIAEAEKIEVNSVEVDAEVEKMVKEADKQAEDIKKLFSLPQARTSIENFLLSRKTMEQLRQIASGLVQVTNTKEIENGKSTS